MTDIIRHPVEFAYSLKREPWRLFRITLCVGICIGFAFWNISARNDAPINDEQVKNDKLIALFTPWYERMNANRNRIPDISSQILALQYVAVIAMLSIFVTRGDFILVAILYSWGIGLFITSVTQLPMAASALRYYHGAWFPLEYIVTDYTVSWHSMILIHCIRAITRVCPFKLLYALAGVVFTLVAMYLLATRNAYFISICLGASIAAAGEVMAWYTQQLVEKYTGDSGTAQEKKPLTEPQEIEIEELGNEL